MREIQIKYELMTFCKIFEVTEIVIHIPLVLPGNATEELNIRDI